MLYRKNVGTKERWVRLLAAGSMAAGAWLWLGATPLGLLLASAAVVTALTGVVGYCPACAMIGRKP